MPTIDKSDYFKQKREKAKRKQTDRRKRRQYVYYSNRWSELRRAKLMEQPLCERCLKMGIYTPAEDVHHIDSFLDHENWRAYAYDYANLMSLCKSCHATIHNQQRHEDY